MSGRVVTNASRRVAVFDGLRGIAIVLVVLSHGWTIWPSGYVYHHRPLDTLFRSGNFAVTLFFAVGAFAATTALMRRARSPQGLHPLVDVVRRYLRLTGQVVLLPKVMIESDPAPPIAYAAYVFGLMVKTFEPGRAACR